MHGILLERCCTCAREVMEARVNGAARAELCERLETGGLTPSEGNIRESVGTGLPVNVLVRPREGDFVYSEEEVETMLGSIRLCRECGANGVVIGALRRDGGIDTDTMGILVREAKSPERPMEVTFHRAFDECREPFTALEEIIGLGCDRLLTSGQAASATEGKELIAELVRRAGERIIIMPGAGVTPATLGDLEKYTKAVEFHGSRLCANIF